MELTPLEVSDPAMEQNSFPVPLGSELMCEVWWLSGASPFLEELTFVECLGFFQMCEVTRGVTSCAITGISQRTLLLRSHHFQTLNFLKPKKLLKYCLSRPAAVSSKSWDPSQNCAFPALTFSEWMCQVLGNLSIPS